MSQLRVLFLALLAACLSTSAFASAKAVKSALEKKLGGVQIVSVTPTPFLGLYEVYTGDRLMYTDAKATVLLNGDLIDLQAMQNVSEARMSALNAVSFSSLPLDQAFKQVHGNGKRVLATFEDPNCGYCKRLAKDLVKLDNVTIYTFLVPMLGPDSLKKSQQIWCAADQAKTWTDWMVDGKAPNGTTECDTSVLRKNAVLAEKLRINGTPTLVFANGERIPGAVPLDKIEQKLGK